MKLYFTFLTKLVVGGILLMPSVDSAVCDSFLEEEEAIPFARDHWLNTFEWEDKFVLKDGSVIRRSEHGITIEKDEIIEESQTQELFIENRNEVTLDCPLDLKMQLSRADFVCKLCQSGLYQETKTEFDGQINLSKAYINKYGHKQYSGCLYRTETLHLKNKKSGRDVCLSAQLSCSEFTRMLFDCGYIIFQSYPPYTIQGLPNGKFAYYYYGDLKKPRAKDKKRKEKESLETMREKQQTEQTAQKEHEQQVKAEQGEDTTILQNQPNVPTNRKKKKKWSLNPLNWEWWLPTGKIAATN